MQAVLASGPLFKLFVFYWLFVFEGVIDGLIDEVSFEVECLIDTLSIVPAHFS